MDRYLVLAFTHALIVLLVPLLLAAIHGRQPTEPQRMRYSLGARIFGAAIPTGVILSSLTLVFTSFVADEARRPIYGLLLLFSLLGMPLVIEFWGVVHGYDNAGVSYRSPWSGRRRVDWSSIGSIEWRPVLKWLDVRPRDGGRALHLSPMLGGLEEFAQLALRQVPPTALGGQVEARAALELMAAGHAARLTLDGESPSKLAARLLPGIAAQRT